MSFTAVILGRPNVGKSTFFNRLAGKRLAIVDDTPGVTRDRREAEAHLGDLDFRIIDTAGLEEGDAKSLFGRMRLQTEAALEKADVAIMLIDARAGVTPLDQHFADWLRRQDIPVVLVANKAEGSYADSGVYEAYSLGLGQPVPFSAEHNEGMADLYEYLVKALQEAGIDPYAKPEKEKQVLPEDGAGAAADNDDPVMGDMDYEFDDGGWNEDKPLQLAVIGRPNAGKSTLINQMIGEERLITGPEAGLTRDSISVDWEWDGRKVRLFDTAGLRKQAKITDRLERLSVTDTMRAIQFAHIVILMIDATRGLERQDLKIAERVIEEGRGLLIALNKWDIVEDRVGTLRAAQDAMTRSLPQAKGVPVVEISALQGQGLQKIMPAVEDVFALWNVRIPTAQFNRWLSAATETHPAPMVSGRRLKIRYGAQIKTRPPTFLLFVNRPKDMPQSYLRYLENELRNTFGLPGVPLRFVMRKGENPYEGQKRRRTASERKASKKTRRKGI